MKRLERYIPEILALVSFFIFWYLIQHTLEYVFFEREHEQIFYYSWSVFLDRYVSIGGLSLLVSQFFVQFFSIPYLASALTSALCVLSAYLLWLSIKKFNAPWWLFPLCFLPAIFQMHAIFDIFYNYSGFVGFCLAILALWIYQSFSGSIKPGSRLLAGAMMTILTYLLIGPSSAVFVIGIIFLDILGHVKMPFLQIVSAAVFFMEAALLVRFGAIDKFHTAISSQFYYDILLDASNIYDACVLIVPLVIFLAWLSGKKKSYSSALGIGLFCICIIALAVARASLGKYENHKTMVVLQMEHDAAVEDWDNILACKDATKGNNYMLMNYVNLAMSHKGILLDRLFDFRQVSSLSLLCAGKESEFNNQIVLLYANIFYWIGDIGLAQNKAFDAFTSCEYGNPDMLKMLVKTNLLFGNSKVAEKYIKLLEKTWGYRSWAKEQRKLLFNEEAIAADPELGPKYRNMHNADSYNFNGDMFSYLRELLKSDYSDAARDYAMASVLLSRDRGMLESFFEEFDVEELFDKIPESVQEAIVVLHENDLEYCRNHGASDAVLDKYEDFKKTYKLARSGNYNSIRTLKSKYRNSFWYYFIYGNN